MPDWDNSERLESDGGRYGNEPRVLKDDTGKPRAARDGYTVVARRLRDDQPGYWTDADQADELERMNEQFDKMFGPPTPGGY